MSIGLWKRRKKNGNWAHFTEASVEEPFNGKSLFVFLGDAKKVQLFFSREAFRKGEPESSEVLYLRGGCWIWNVAQGKSKLMPLAALWDSSTVHGSTRKKKTHLLWHKTFLPMILKHHRGEPPSARTHLGQSQARGEAGRTRYREKTLPNVTQSCFHVWMKSQKLKERV